MIHGLGAPRGSRRGLFTGRRLRAGAVVAALILTAGVGVSVAADRPETTAYRSIERINAGGDQYTDWQGQSWSADIAVVGGTESKTDAAINGTWDQELFKTQRTGTMTYEVPVEKGKYTVRLYFAAIEGGGSGPFDVAFEGKKLIQGYDIEATVGKNTVDVAQLVVDSSGDTLDIAFSGSKPSVAAIEVLEVVDASKVPKTGMTDVPPAPAMPTEPAATDDPAPSVTPSTTPKSTDDPVFGPESDAWTTDDELLGTDDELTGSDTTTELQLNAAPKSTAPKSTAPKSTASMDKLVDLPAQVTKPNTKPGKKLEDAITKPVAGKSGYRMNIGGGAVEDDGELLWRADKATGGKTAKTGAPASVAPTLVDVRTGTSSITVPVLNGSYSLELAFLQSNEFDVRVEGYEVALQKKVDAGSLDTLSVPVTITDGVLNIELTGADDKSPALASLELLMPELPVKPVSDNEPKACTMEMLMVDGIAVTQHPDFIQPVHKDDNCEWVDGQGNKIDVPQGRPGLPATQQAAR